MTDILNYQDSFQTTEWIFHRLDEAVRKREGLALIRIGDGETRTMAHNDLIMMEEIPPWLRYAGVILPDEVVKRRLIQSVREAEIVGLPVEKNYYFQPLMIELLARYHLEPRNICSNRINYHLYTGGFLQQLIRERKIIIIGRKARTAVPFFNKMARVVGSYNLPDINSLEKTYHQILKNPDYQIALVAAGIPAVILCPWLARQNKVAIDLGHVIDGIVTPDRDLFQLMEDWLKKNRPRARIIHN